MKIEDTTTSIIKRAIDLLFIKNPTGTSMGVFFGIVLHWITMLFIPVIKAWSSIIDINALRLVYFIPFGVFIFNIKPVIFDGQKHDAEYEKELSKIQRAKKDGLISKEEAALQFTNLVRASVKNHCIKHQELTSTE